MQKKSPTYKKDDVYAPTVHNDSVMITSAINAHEKRDVMTVDCPGAFLWTMASDPVLMKLRGPLVEALLLIDPDIYRDYSWLYVITGKNEEKMLYVRMSKALYGLLKSALDFYNKLRSNLEDNGFIVNSQQVLHMRCCQCALGYISSCGHPVSCCVRQIMLASWPLGNI